MLGDEYRDFVRKMSTKPDGSTMPLYVAALGLAGELREVDLARRGLDGQELLLELGDLLFYVTAVAEGLGVSDADLTDFADGDMRAPASQGGAWLAVGELCEFAKKAAWHSAPSRANTINCIYNLVLFVRAFCDLPFAQAANVAKLTARHPKGFNP